MEAIFAAPLGALLIGLLRVIDVSMATIRMILSVRGRPVLASCIAFFEVIIWVVAVGNALKHVDSVLHILGYASGFAAGNFLGVWIEERLAIGINVIHTIHVEEEDEGVSSSNYRVADILRNAGYAVTELTGQGHNGAVKMLNIVVRRRHIGDVMRILKDHDPGVFITIEEVKSLHGGYIRPGGRKSPSVALQ